MVAKALAQLFSASGIWGKEMIQAGSGVAGLSSFGISFNHYGLCFIFGRWAESVSFELDILVVSGIGMSSLVAQHEDWIVAWRSLKEHLKCQTSSMLMTEELEAVMNQKCQFHVLLVVLRSDLKVELEEPRVQPLLQIHEQLHRTYEIGAYVVGDAGLGGERSITGTGVDSGGTEEDA
uniref:Uncharacterized protein n=1 Tax=Tanacetum cinerariifolium TaxID=118510 RepID=A0A699H653_TANCI|nr:hypothetical protein [Tanacetum cinerariifolium]